MQPTQGVNPDTVFSDLYPVLYAAAEPIDGGSYFRMSEICATIAAARSGLRGAHVLDIGSGYGTTTLAISSFAPKIITAVDSSSGMIELMRMLFFGDEDITSWLRARGADIVLGDYFERTAAHLMRMRVWFRGGVFRRRGGELDTVIGDGLVVDRLCRGSRADVVIGNNYLHWPVNQQLAKFRERNFTGEEALREACRDALQPLARALKPGGIAVLMEPNDFVTADDDAAEQADLLAASMVSHPVFIRFHEAVNAILKREYGIERAVPTVTDLFPTSRLAELAASGGFRLVETIHVEGTYPCDPLDAFFVRLPMLAGSLKIPFEAKLGLGRVVREELRQTLTEEERGMPVRSQWFFFVFEKQ